MRRGGGGRRRRRKRERKKNKINETIMSTSYFAEGD
jgi:hypothetical protein